MNAPVLVKLNAPKRSGVKDQGRRRRRDEKDVELRLARRLLNKGRKDPYAY